MKGRIDNTIRRWRFEAGEMTQKDLAQRAGVTRQTIVAIEGGQYAPSLDLAFRIAHALGQPIGAVFSWVPESPSPATRPPATRPPET
ncbi:MAG: helix-turn-helix transcriptional regulator [Gemmobacter sp.]